MKPRSARVFVVGACVAWALACGSSESDERNHARNASGAAGSTLVAGAGGTSGSPEAGRAGAASGAGTTTSGGKAGGGGAGGRSTAGGGGTATAGGAAGTSSAEAGTGASGGDAGAPGTCSGALAAVLFVIDTSLSMNEALPSRASKWEVTSSVVASAIDALPDSLPVGMMFFPQAPQRATPCFDGSLAVPFGPLDAAQRDVCRAALASTEVDGGTPTMDAYAYAEQEVAPLRGAGPTALVLVTDGLPSYGLGCTGDGAAGELVDWAQLVAMVDAAAQVGTYTLAVAAPDSAATHEMLTAVASAGEPPGLCAGNTTPGCFFDLDTSLELGAWLADSLALAGACRP